MLEKKLNSQCNDLFFIRLFIFSLMCLLLIGGWGTVANAQSRDDLWIYVTNDRASNVQALLDQGLDPNTRDSAGNPIIMQAVRDDAWAVFDVVMNHPKTDLRIMNGYQETPLMYVSLVGDLERAKALVARGAQINHLGWTPLHYAASTGKLPVVRYLLAQGALPNAPAPDGSSPILMAAQAGAIDTVQVLLDAGADPAAINTNGVDAAQAARNRGNDKLADALDAFIIKRREQQRQAN
jgi:hypothetical protein